MKKGMLEILCAATALVTIVYLLLEQGAAVTPGNRILVALTGGFGAVIVLIIAALSATIVGKMISGDISLTDLIADDDGRASLSRFQMLLFTFVVATLYFIYALYWLGSPNCKGCISGNDTSLVTLKQAITYLQALEATEAKSLAAGLQKAMDQLTIWGLPDIPNSILGLLGISGGSYLLSKGIQKAADSTQQAGVNSQAATSAQQAAENLSTQLSQLGTDLQTIVTQLGAANQQVSALDPVPTTVVTSLNTALSAAQSALAAHQQASGSASHVLEAAKQITG